jgi:hypothetical protein
LKDLNLLVVSDTHVNSTVALLSPKAEISDGGGVILSRWQNELWEAWLDMILKVKVMSRKIPLYVVMLGDMVEVDFKSRSTQVVTRDKELVINNAIETFDPLMQIADKVFWIAGTEAHTGAGGEYERILADNYDNTEKVDGRNTSQYLRKIFAGQRYDFSHHVSMGGIPWTEKNAANKLASILIFEYAEWNEPLPHYAVRGHVHRVSDSGMNYPVRVLTAPCWCGPTTYIHRIGKGNVQPHIGGLLFKTRNGKPEEPEWMRYAFKRQGWSE